MIRFRVSNLTFYNNNNKNDAKSTKGNKSIFDYIQTLKDEFNKQENKRILIGINEKKEKNSNDKNNNIIVFNKNNKKNQKSEKNNKKQKQSKSKTLSNDKLKNKNNIDNSIKKNKKQRNSVKCVDILNLLNNMKQFK